MPDLDKFGWLIFSSPNAVSIFIDGLQNSGSDIRCLAGLRIAAVGSSTASYLAERGLKADLIPKRFLAEGLLEEFAKIDSSSAQGILIPRALSARETLPEGLRSQGFQVKVLPIYKTVAGSPDQTVVEQVKNGDYDAVTFVSSSAVKNFKSIIGAPKDSAVIVSIGPITSETAHDNGIVITAEANDHTLSGVIESLVDTLS